MPTNYMTFRFMLYDAGIEYELIHDGVYDRVKLYTVPTHKPVEFYFKDGKLVTIK